MADKPTSLHRELWCYLQISASFPRRRESSTFLDSRLRGNDDNKCWVGASIRQRYTGAQRGFSYLLVLFFVAITGAGLAAASQLWVTAVQRDREAELIFVGNEFREAIGRYHAATPGAVKLFPPTLEDLLKDPRFPDTRRYLREIHADPITGSRDWLLIKAPQGGIMGVASTSEDAPLKRAGFTGADHVFEEQAERLKEKLRYRDWEFVFLPGLNPPPLNAFDMGGGS